MSLKSMEIKVILDSVKTRLSHYDIFAKKGGTVSVTKLQERHIAHFTVMPNKTQGTIEALPVWLITK